MEGVPAGGRDAEADDFSVVGDVGPRKGTNPASKEPEDQDEGTGDADVKGRAVVEASAEELHPGVILDEPGGFGLRRSDWLS